MLSISLGPFVVSPERLVFLFAFAVSLLAGWLSGRRLRVTVEPVLMQMLVGGLIVGRIAFVWRYWDEYGFDFLRIIDVRDGGIWFEVSIVAAVLIGLLHCWKHPSIRRHLAAAVITGALTWIGGWFLLGKTMPQGADLAHLNLLSVEGQTLQGSAFIGKPLVVNLWATWCPPCRREMPVLADAQQTEPTIEFVFVSQGEGSEAVSAYLQREQLLLRNVFLDPDGHWSRQFGAAAMPTTLFFDEQGRLRDSHTGELSRATLKKRMQSIKK